MATKREPTTVKTKEEDAGVELDTLNAEIRNQGTRASNLIARSIEADIEAKAKKRRRSEPNTSSAMKRGT